MPNATRIDPLTVGLSAATIAIIIIANRRKLPGSLIALCAAISAAFLLNLEAKGLSVVPDFPGGLPPLSFAIFRFEDMATLLPAAISIAIVILVQSSAVIRNTAARFDEQVDDNRDLAALGGANIVSSISQGFVINGSPPRTIAAEMSGGRTQMVNVWMSLLVGLILIFSTRLLAYLPLAALAAVVFTIGMHLFDIKKLLKIWRSRRTECVVALIALFGVALFGVLYGVAIAIISSILDRMRRQYRPDNDVLLRDQKLADWAEDRIDSHHKHRSSPPGVLVYRFGGSIFFENAQYFADQLNQAVKTAQQPVHYIILDAGAINDLDYTAAEMLKHVCLKYKSENTRFVLAHVPPALQRLLDRFDLTDIVGKHNIFPSLEAAIFDAPTSRRSSSDMIARLNPPAGEYIVIGGGVLETLGIRHTSDLDIVVSPKLYRNYHEKRWKEYTQDDGKTILSHNGYQIMQSYVGKTLKDLLPHAQYVDNVAYMSIADLIECKRKMGRKKDLADLDLIKAYMDSNPST